MSISIIIPTHNRLVSLQRLLHALETQTCSKELIQVIVVADNCSDGTENWLTGYDPIFDFKWIQSSAGQAATARNLGAGLATNTILLFLDDDILPDPGLIAIHLQGHGEVNNVIIGYLPYAGPIHTSHNRSVRAWWTRKFNQMEEPGYLFSYDDLLSGHFSIRAELYESVGGFDESFDCCEDYELGYRLIKADARFKFIRDACGQHFDQNSTLNRTVHRKKLEGIASVRFTKKHPEMALRFHQKTLRYPLVTLQSKKIDLFFHAATLMEVYRLWLYVKFFVLSATGFTRKKWNTHYRLQMWYYLFGIVKETKSLSGLNELKQQLTASIYHHEPLVIDLSSSLTQAWDVIDEIRPKKIKLRWQELTICTVESRVGEESCHSAFVKQQLINHYPEQFLAVQALTTAIPQNKK